MSSINASKPLYGNTISVLSIASGGQYDTPHSAFAVPGLTTNTRMLVPSFWLLSNFTK